MMRTLSRWFQPAPDSAVANVVRRGKSPWTDAVHLMWSIWVFTLPAIGGGRYDARWLWLTLPWYPSGISYFVFGCVMLRTCSGRFLMSLLPRLVALNAVFVAVAWHFGYPLQV